MTYKVKYTNKTDFVIGDLIGSLAAQEEALKIITETLHQYNKDWKIKKIELKVDKINIGSLEQIHTPEISSSVQYDMFQSGVRLSEGAATPHDIAVLLTGLVGCVIIGAGLVVLAKITGKEQPQPIIINNSFNSALEDLKSSGLDIREVLEIILNKKSKKDLAKMVTSFVKPAKKGGASAIMSGDKTLISKECVEAIPTYLEAVEDDIEYKLFTDFPIKIVATDLENRSRGWAARLIGGEYDNYRVPLIISADIDLEKTALMPSINADFTLELINKKGKFNPIKIHLLKLHDDV